MARIQVYTAENISESCGRVLQDLLHISRLDLLLKSPLFHAIFLFYQQQQNSYVTFPTLVEIQFSRCGYYYTKYFKFLVIHCLSSYSRLHAYWRCGCSTEAPGCASRGPAGLRGFPAPGGSPSGRQAAHDPPLAPPDLHQGCATLLQHQAGWQSPNAQTLFGAAGSQGLRTGTRWKDS